MLAVLADHAWAGGRVTGWRGDVMLQRWRAGGRCCHAEANIMDVCREVAG